MISSSALTQFYRYLYEHREMDLYGWHQLTCISPIELAAIINKEIEKGIIQLNEDKISVSLTEYGKKWLEVNSTTIFAEKREMPWKDIPDEMLSYGDKLFDNLFDAGNELQHLLDNLKRQKGGDES